MSDIYVKQVGGAPENDRRGGVEWGGGAVRVEAVQQTEAFHDWCAQCLVQTCRAVSLFVV